LRSLLQISRRRDAGRTRYNVPRQQ